MFVRLLVCVLIYSIVHYTSVYSVLRYLHGTEKVVYMPCSAPQCNASYMEITVKAITEWLWHREEWMSEQGDQDTRSHPAHYYQCSQTVHTMRHPLNWAESRVPKLNIFFWNILIRLVLLCGAHCRPPRWTKNLKMFRNWVCGCSSSHGRLLIKWKTQFDRREFHLTFSGRKWVLNDKFS